MYDEPTARAPWSRLRPPAEVTIAHQPLPPATPTASHAYTEGDTTPGQALRIMRRQINALLPTLTPDVQATTEEWLLSPEEYHKASRQLGCRGKFEFKTGDEPPYLTARIRYANPQDPPTVD